MLTPAQVSKTTLELWNSLGPWQQADATYLLLALCDSLGYQYDETEQYTRDDASHTGWGQLLDVNVCPAVALPWLAQFAGVALAPNMTEAQQRAAIHAQNGSKRGTLGAIVSAVQNAGLTGTQRVDVYERTPDPYSFEVVTYLGETPGGASGAVATAILALLTSPLVKPAGLVLSSYNVQAGITWAQATGTWSTQTNTWAQESDLLPGG